MTSAISQIQKPRAAVLYHYPCPDGVFAALAASLYHQKLGITVKYIPNTVYDPVRPEDVDTEGLEVVYLLDFAGPPGFALSLAERANRLVLLDHHKTAAEGLPDPSLRPPNFEVVMDMGRSGATIAWDYFSALLVSKQGESALLAGGEESTARVHRLFKYIEDGDLWRWELPQSKEFSSGLGDLALEYDAGKNPEIFEKLLSLSREDLVAQGTRTLLRNQQLIDAAISGAFVVNLGGRDKGTGGAQFGSCLAVLATEVAHLRSELGNQLAVKSVQAGHRAMAAVAYEEAAMDDPSKLKVSLRSKGEEDTTAISKAYGGGGHLNASSFVIARDEFLNWKAA